MLEVPFSFYILALVAAAFFALGVAGHGAFWIKTSPGLSLRRVIAPLGQKRTWGLFFSHVLFQRQVLRQDRLRWLMSISFTWGCIELLFVGSLLGALSAHGLLPFALTRDTPWFALMNDLGGLLVLLGVSIALYRRYRIEEVRAVWAWWPLFTLLLIIGLVGYLTEAVRLLWQGVPTGVALYSPVGFLLSRLISPLEVSWGTAHAVLWWAHAVLALSLVAYLPYSPLLHTIATPLYLVTRPVAPATWGRGLAPTLALEACTGCGECVRACETYTGQGLSAPTLKLKAYNSYLKGEKLPPILSRLLGGRRPSHEEIVRLTKGTYGCTLCGRCATWCPVKIDMLPIWISLREDLVGRIAYPGGLNRAREAVAAEHNVFAYPNGERALWVEYMAEPPQDLYRKEHAETLYFVGCIASFSPKVQSIPEAFARVLTRAGVDFAIMGEGEWCCGFPLMVAGMGQAAEELKRHNIQRVREVGARRLVFTCPSCYRTWIHEYKGELGDVELLHATQFLERLLSQGRISLSSLPQRVTYHDPCDLGRNSGIYEEPRRVIRAIPGLDFVELGQNRERGHCCGGGGDLEISDRDLASTIARRTLTTIEDSGTQVLITACQQCKRMFLEAKAEKESKIEVLDLAELVSQVMR